VYPLWTESCRRAGVGEKALRALSAGAGVDPARDTQVANCCRQIVRRPRDLGLASQSLHDTAELFATMVDSALQRAERHQLQAAETGAVGQVA